MSDDTLDDEHPLWCVNAQIKDILDGYGAMEDHEAVLSFLRNTGLPECTIRRMHQAIVKKADAPTGPVVNEQLITAEECAHLSAHTASWQEFARALSSAVMDRLAKAEPEMIAMAKRVAWVEANPAHHAMPYFLRGKWIVAAPLNAENCGYTAFDTWSEAIDAARGKG